MNEISSVLYDRDIHKENSVLTNFYPPSMRAESGWANGGKMTHAEWLRHEIAAYKRNGRTAIAVRNNTGDLALAEMPKNYKART